MTLGANGSVLSQAKWAFTTRRVATADVAGLESDLTRARSGDLVLARVGSVGQHKNLQLRTGRMAQLYRGDLVVAACGDRYAPDQFEAVASLDGEGADLVAGGGIIGRMRHAHTDMSAPTSVRPLGLLTHATGKTVNVASYGLPFRRSRARVPVIAVVGSAMNAGKTTVAASLIHGLSRGGLAVGAAKVTGTGASKDVHAFADAGAHRVLDFTDAGMASTYRQSPARIGAAMESLVAHLIADGAEAVVMEVADGVYQAETAALMRRAAFRRRVDGVVFAATDALGAVAGDQAVRSCGLSMLAMSGLFTNGPLASQETQTAVAAPVKPTSELLDPACALRILDGGHKVPGPVESAAAVEPEVRIAASEDPSANAAGAPA
ncbi:hypothetical protein SAMN05216241_102355 [Limimonas halophila]|uniref:DUF1611 domain-containing protein n=1 Tax=Limimonas halophila TaxID=1082479 RepID=A0A1G7NXL0_9PROT|nr:hypothetical protein [Limimonas halophila]SDF78765.1 hypothetical protein SAMN05216241_102355 [Limimonas halophila]